MMRILLLLMVSTITVAATKYKRLPTPWAYSCIDGLCVKEFSTDVETILTLEGCKTICGKHGRLWPIPTDTVALGDKVIPFAYNNIKFKSFTAPNKEVTQMMKESAKIFLGYLRSTHPAYKDREYREKGINPYDHDYAPYVQNINVAIEVAVVGPDVNLSLETDESYTLSLAQTGDIVQVLITANTYFGSRHAIETLSQLISYNSIYGSLQIINEAVVNDRPKYPYRGILIDTSRNFFSVESLKRIIDAMSYDKLNTMHWHITDTHSFSIFSRRVPQMSYYGAYSPHQVYQPEEVRDIVYYGRIRGVRILPEFDAPSHVGNGWQWGKKEGKGRMAVCVNQEPWLKYCVEPPCGQLNPVNDNIYEVLGKIYQDYLDMFQTDLFHMGGDEVNINCWNTTEEIVHYMEKNNMSRTNDAFIDLWGKFQDKSYMKLKQANEGRDIPIILWTSRLTHPGQVDKYLDKDRYIIQIWTTGTDVVIKELLSKGYRVIFSNHDALYFDCGYGAWVGEGNNWCSPYKGWQTVYNNRPLKLLQDFGLTSPENRVTEVESLVQGGEATMWSEEVDEQTVEGKVWPRASALAERLWSDPTSGWEEAEYRMVQHRYRLVQRGIQADRLQPEWCRQNEGHCSLKPSPGNPEI